MERILIYASALSVAATAFSPTGLNRGEGTFPMLATHSPFRMIDVDLLQAIAVPFDDPKHLYFAEGDPTASAGGFPAYGVRAGSSVKTPLGLLYERRELSPEFGVAAHFRAADEQGGFLFAVVDPLERSLQLAVEVSAASRGDDGKRAQSVRVYAESLTKIGQSMAPAVAVAEFHVDALEAEWTRMKLTVRPM